MGAGEWLFEYHPIRSDGKSNVFLREGWYDCAHTNVDAHHFSFFFGVVYILSKFFGVVA